MFKDYMIILEDNILMVFKPTTAYEGGYERMLNGRNILFKHIKNDKKHWLTGTKKANLFFNIEFIEELKTFCIDNEITLKIK